MDRKKQDKIIYNLFYDNHQKHLGTLELFEYSESALIIMFEFALNQSDTKNIKLKIKEYIHRNWLSCGKKGYIINPKLFNRYDNE